VAVDTQRETAAAHETSMNGKLCVFLFLACLGPAMASDANWRAVIGHDPLQHMTACLLESKPLTVFDGQTDTPLQLIYNGTVFRMTSQSHVDLSYPGVGLRVDGQELFAVDTVENRTDLIFSSRADAIKEQFIAGRQAQIAVGFWPTWPRSDTVVARFSLLGFSRAYTAFRHCQTTGEPPDHD
jgi:hypothetical protein